MNILVYGAGVVGSLYAARLHASGHTVSVLARGRRLDAIRAQGIIVEDDRTGERIIAPVRVVDRLSADDTYDLAIVVLRENQIAAALPMLASNRAICVFLFMGNHLSGSAPLVAAVGADRVLLGFPGAGGLRDGDVIRYRVLAHWQQPTTLGEVNGHVSPRLREIARTLAAAGFPVATCTDMAAWYKAHVAWTLPVSTALYAAGGDIHQLANTREALALMIRAIRENFRVLRALHIPVTPRSLRAFDQLPEVALIALLGRLFATPTAEIVIAGHANVARDEYRYLADAWRTLARTASVATPAGEQLDEYLDASVPPLVRGRGAAPSSRRRATIAICILSGIVIAVALLRTRSWHCRRGMTTHRGIAAYGSDPSR